jgi:lipopolysaccharide transport system ATP-binding protein
VREGEIVGIIGGNGAGKSTLLKILARITSPTEGVFRSRGVSARSSRWGPASIRSSPVARTSSSIAPFSVLSRREVRRKFDEIASFPGVERFLDTPVKRYSSGMYLRLAFSVPHIDHDRRRGARGR